MTLCTVSVVVGVHLEWLDCYTADYLKRTEDGVVSQWREISADEKHHLRDGFDEILRPLPLQTRLVVLERANSIALYFICMTLSALMSLRDLWFSQQLRGIVRSLIDLLYIESKRQSPDENDDKSTSMVFSLRGLRDKDVDRCPMIENRLIWRLSDYCRCLGFFSSVQG